MTEKPRDRSYWLVRVPLATSLAGLSAAAADLAWLAFHPDQGWAEGQGGWVGACYLLGLGAIGGIALALPVSILTGICVVLGRWGKTWKSPGVLLASAAILGVFAILNRRTFDGPEIKQLRMLPLVVVGFYATAAVATVFLARWGAAALRALAARGAAARILASVPLVAGGAALHHVDGTRYVGLYPDIHLQLAASLIGAAAITALIALMAASVRLRRRLWFIVFVFAMAPAGLRFHDDIGAARTPIALRAINLRQWMVLPELLVDRVRSLPRAAVGDVKSILAANRPDAVIDARVERALERMAPARRRLNLLVISIDTLRVDHLSHHGYSRPTTPNIDSFAEDAIVFTRCYTPYPTSAQAFSAFFSGRHPSSAPSSWETEGKPSLLPADGTLAGMLAAKGFETAAESAFNRGSLGDRRIFGHLKDGFRSFNPVQPLAAREGEEISAAGVAQLERLAGDRFFLWLHFLDPHHPYDHHPEFDFGVEPVDRYDSEIAYVDAQVGRVFESLRDLDLDDDTAVLIMSDHGEEFSEHLSRYHNTSLYEEQVRVPLMLRVPGAESREVSDVVSLTDVTPTLLRMFDINDPHVRNGRDLWPRVFGELSVEGFVFAELEPRRFVSNGARRMVVYKDHKLISDARTRTDEIYDLAADPRERRNLAGRAGEIGATLRGLLRATELDVTRMRNEGGGTVRADPVAELHRRVEELLSLDRKELSERLGAFVGDVTDPVFGIDRAYQSGLSGALGDDLATLVRRSFDPVQLNLGFPAIRLANRLEDSRLLPFAKSLTIEHPLLSVELAVLRGLLGDETVIPELEERLAREGTPDKHSLAMAMLLLGRPTDLAASLALSQTRWPLEVARTIRGMGLVRAPELLPLADAMLNRKEWRYGPLKTALVEALTGFPSEPRRNRLLGRLAADYASDVAARAREILERDLGAAEVSSWLAGGGAEAEADAAIEHRRFDAAISYLQLAVDRYPVEASSLILGLARLRQCYGDNGRVRADLLAARKRLTGSHREAIEVRLADSSASVARTVELKVTKAAVDRRALRRRWYLMKVTLQNTGSRVWPGGSYGLHLDFNAVILDEGGREIDITPSWWISVGTNDVPPGASIELGLPFIAPRPSGRYSLAVRGALTLPNATRKTTPAIPTGATLEVVGKLAPR